MKHSSTPNCLDGVQQLTFLQHTMCQSREVQVIGSHASKAQAKAYRSNTFTRYRNWENRVARSSLLLLHRASNSMLEIMVILYW